MMTQSKQKKRKLFMSLLRWVIALSALVFIYRKLIAAARQDWWSAMLMTLHDGASVKWLFWCMLLLPFNWLTEALKWRNMMRPLERVGLMRSLQGVLAGLAVSVFTPNRIGEYAGRVFVLRSADRLSATFATMLSSLSQLAVTLVAGTLAAIWYFPLLQDWPPVFSAPLLACCSVAALATLFLFLNLKAFNGLMNKLPLPAALKKHVAVAALYSFRDRMAALLLSFVRYLVFTTQFYCLLRFFGAPVPFVPAWCCIAVVYLIMAIVPTVALFEVGLRGSVAVAIFSSMTDRLEAVLFASSLLWLVNLMLPAIFGTYFVTRLDFSRSSA